MIEHMANKGFG